MLLNIKFLKPNKLNKILLKCLSTSTALKPVDLAFATYENPNIDYKEAPFVIVHGIFGSKQNWISLCKAYSQRIGPPRKVIALDLRNHGDSIHSEEHSYPHLVEDIKHFLLSNHIEKIALMGHSMGGRCAMLFALTYPELLEKLIVVDISPVAITHLHGLPQMLDIMQRVHLPKEVPLSKARTIVDSQLAEVVPDKEVRAFLLTNLVAEGNKSFKWRINIPTLIKKFDEIINFPKMDNTQYMGDTLFIGGENSTFIPVHASSKPRRLVYAVDLRNHGDSGYSKGNSYDDLVMDILKFLRTMNLRKVALLGHDIGGRVGMLLSLKYPELVDKLIVSDISPITTSHSFKVIPEILRALNNLVFPENLPLQAAKTHVTNSLTPLVRNKGLMSLILMNLIQKSNGSYSWRFNNKALLEHFQELSAFPNVYNISYHGPVLFVGGAKSDYIQKSDYPKILKLFPYAELKYIEGAGHWVHAEKPKEFLKLTLDFLNKKPSSES